MSGETQQNTQAPAGPNTPQGPVGGISQGTPPQAWPGRVQDRPLQREIKIRLKNPDQAEVSKTIHYFKRLHGSADPARIHLVIR